MMASLSREQIARLVRATCVDGNDFRDADVPHIVALIMGDPMDSPEEVKRTLHAFSCYFRDAAQSDKWDELLK